MNSSATLRLLLLGSSLFLLSACSTDHTKGKNITCSPKTVNELEECLNYAGLHPDTEHATFVEVTTFPPDIGQITNLKQKKQTFFYSLLPLIREQNLNLIKSRNRLSQLATAYKYNRPLSNVEKSFLSDLAKKFRVKSSTLTQEHFNILLNRVDTIPEELVLAQAANESAWGSSRFAQLGNNIFGEWTFKPGTGIIPEGRPEGKTYEVRKFKKIKDSIDSYMTNLNSHRSYKTFRELRAQHRLNGNTASGTELAEGLLYYSTRRDEYVRDIKELIRGNNLETFNDIKIYF